MNVTTTCRNCSHVFLAYAHRCPECGTPVRRAKTSTNLKLALGALAVSGAIIAGTFRMITKFQEGDTDPVARKPATESRPKAKPRPQPAPNLQKPDSRSVAHRDTAPDQS